MIHEQKINKWNNCDNSTRSQVRTLVNILIFYFILFY